MREVEREIISRRPEHSVDLALDRMAELVGLLGDPQRACPVIHITGTNGKTSTARMTDALLRSRGLRTGRFTSPHLVSIRERLVVDGAPVSAERFVEAYDELLPYVRLVDERHRAAVPRFEVLTGVALARVAAARVGVLRREQAVGAQQLSLPGLRGTYEDISLPLFGSYQAGNAACALAAVEAFAGVSDENVYGPAGLDPDLVREAFATVTSPGRLEVIRRSPTILIDAAHNPAGMAATVAAVEESFSFSPLVGVFAASGHT